MTPILPPTLWTDMSSAPKNPAGTHGHRGDLDIDLWHKRQGRLASCFWYAEHDAWFTRSGGRAYNMGDDETFSHWMRPCTPFNQPSAPYSPELVTAALNAFIEKSPALILNARVFEGQELFVRDWMETPAAEEARNLGVEFINGEGYSIYGDARDAEETEALSELLRRGMRAAGHALQAETLFRKTE